MSRFYFSGIEKKSTAQVLCCTHSAGMMSQLLYSPALLTACEDIPLVLDSGAFTKILTRRDIERYAALILLLGERCIWYSNADEVGSQERSNDNYQFLLSLLPEHLHKRILWIYQQSGDRAFLYEGLEKHTRIGIGGLVPILKEDKRKARRLILELATIIRQYDCIPHFFGFTVPDVLQELREILDEYSVDSTTWLVAGMYGHLINAQGQQRRATEGGYDFSTFAMLEQNVRTMKAWVEGPVLKENTKRKPYTQLSFLESAG